MKTTVLALTPGRQAPPLPAPGLRPCFSGPRLAHAATCVAVWVCCLAAPVMGAEAELGHWVFSAGRGDLVPDASGRGNEASLHGVGWTQAEGRNALDFDGNRGVVRCADRDVESPTDAITVEAWIFPRSSGQGDYGRVVEHNVYSLMMHPGLGWGLAFVIQDSEGKTHNSAWGEAVEFEQWYHLVGRYDGQQQKLFVNGVEGGVSAEWRGTIRPSREPLLIGNIGGGSEVAGSGARTFDGLIDEVVVFSRALTDAEIATRYRLGRQARGAAPGAVEPDAVFTETFADPAAVSRRWEFVCKAGKCQMTLEPRRARDTQSAYIDFREQGTWDFCSRDQVTLEAGAQYTLSARVRRRLGYTETRLLVRPVGPTATALPPLAEVPISKRSGEPERISVVFTAREGMAARVGFEGSGYAEIWIDEVRLRRNLPPLSSYTTGILLPARSPTAQARFRTGVFLEAEDLVATPEAVTDADVDGEGRWAVCRLVPARNPWLFSEDTVIKSDSLSAAEGGNLPALKLTATGLLPGPYEVILSDPQRDAAISLDGQAWRQVKGGAGELNLGLLEVTGSLSIWVAHRFRTEGNPGPIYVDYLRLMPVYDAAGGLERPVTAAPAPSPAPVQRAGLRLVQSRGVSRRQEWVSAGLPFARGAFRPGDGIRVAGASELATQALVLWPDGSVKWLRLQFQADVDGEAINKDLAVEYGRGVPTAPVLSSPGPTAAGETMRCGAIEVTVKDGVWDRLTLAGRVLVSQPPAVRLRTATGLSCERLRVESVAAAGGGARGSVCLKGHLVTADGSLAPIAFEALLAESAPQTLSLRFSVLNESDEAYEPEKGCGRAAPLTELVLVLNGIRVEPTAVQWPTVAVPFDGTAQALLQAGSGNTVAEFKGQWTLRAGAVVVASGERTDGWLDLRGAGAGLVVGVREFVERGPRSLAVRQGRGGLTVELGIWPADEGRVLRFAQGTRLTAEVALVAHDGSLAAADREARLAAVLDPLTALSTPAYYCQTGVFGPVTDRRDSRFEGYYAGAAHSLKTLLAEHMRYGAEDWGDTFDRCGYVRTESKLWTNMEWNYVATLVLEFVRSGDPEFWRAAQRAARHFVDIDVAHVSATPAWTGGAYVHTGDTREGHQVDRPDFAHAGWPEGLLWIYYMAGDERLRETSVGLADYVVRNLPPDGPYQAQPPFSMWNCDRQAGNPILTLASVYELSRDPAHWRALNRLVDFALRVQDPKLGCWSVPNYEEPARHYPSPAWGAVLPQGLYRYWQLTGDERVAQAFRRLGDFHLGRHPTETRYYLKPDSNYRSNFYFVSEACAFASLFAADPQPLIERGLVPLAEVFPAAAPRDLDARGAPGALSGANRLAGAAAAQSAPP